MSNIKLDKSGNIDTIILEKELQIALESDVRYKQTDGMKKRAIKVAQSYDEFKNMVACAHQKPVTRQEIESLRDIKKGWQKNKITKKTNTIVLEKESIVRQDQQIDIQKIMPKKDKRPETSMDFERDWRRLRSSNDKKDYLIRTKLKRLIKILKTDLSTEIFQEIIEILLFDENNESITNVSSEIENENGRVNGVNNENQIITDKVLWFKAFSEIDRFSLMLSFLDQTIREKILTYLSSEKCLTDCNLITEEEKESIIRKYTLTK